MSGVIHYATPQIAEVAQQIAQAATQTEQNHQHSLQTVNANAILFLKTDEVVIKSVMKKSEPESEWAP